jgi:hypothetical protein
MPQAIAELQEFSAQLNKGSLNIIHVTKALRKQITPRKMKKSTRKTITLSIP